MAGKTRIIGDRALVEAARIREHEMTENLFGHMEDLREILDGIPAHHRGAAKIGIWGEGDLVITYERPATPEEIEIDRAELRQGVCSNENWIRKQIENVLRDAAALGMASAEIGISVEKDAYVVTR